MITSYVNQTEKNELIKNVLFEINWYQFSQ